MKFTVKDITSIGLFAGVTAIMSQIFIYLPITPVPITLQVPAVVLSAAVTSKKNGVLSQIIYVLMGIIGLPVFSGFKSGLGVLLGPNGGYITSFPIAAFIVGLVIMKSRRKGYLSIFIAMLSGLMCIYIFGAIWLSINQDIFILKAFILGAGIFLPFDIVKISVAAYVAKRLLRC